MTSGSGTSSSTGSLEAVSSNTVTTVVASIGAISVSPKQAAPSAATDSFPAGNAVVIWTDLSKRVRTSMRRAGSSFAAASFPALPTTVEPSQTFSSANAQVAMNAAGHATAVWQRTIAAGRASTMPL